MTENNFELEREKFEREIKIFKKKSIIENIKITMLLILLVVEIVVITIFLAQKGILKEPEEGGKDKIAVVNIDQVITNGYIFKTMNKIDKVLEKKEYKEILVIMNSPGGSPTASEEMANYLKAIQSEKNVTMYVGGYALSGGYYIASAIKPLRANKNALVGSIGVILQHYNIEELAKRVGVEESTITKGKFKQPLSFFKTPDANQTEYLNNNMLHPTYVNFIDSVAQNRGLKYEAIEKYAEGMIFVANSPKIKNILVDEITSLYELRQGYKKKYGKKVKFIDITKEPKPFSFMDAKVDFNLADIKMPVIY
ncbi:MAG: signal peptide peptidase SppA [Campylobacterales bacterium]|nr:signal peptide peptidase SppA [Campylobacterales bacterium]